MTINEDDAGERERERCAHDDDEDDEDDTDETRRTSMPRYERLRRLCRITAGRKPVAG